MESAESDTAKSTVKESESTASVVKFLKQSTNVVLSLMENPDFDFEHEETDYQGNPVNLLQLALQNDHPRIATYLATLQHTMNVEPFEARVAKYIIPESLPDIFKNIINYQAIQFDDIIENYTSRPFYVAVFSHGCLYAHPSKTFASVVPDGMTLSTITATHPGKMNYAFSKDFRDLMQDAIEYLSDNNPTDIPFAFLSDLIATNQHTISETNPTFAEEDYDKTKGQPRVMTYTSGEVFVPKQIQGNWSNMNAIVALDYIGRHEIVDITFALCETKEDDFETTTPTILKILKSKGITNVVLIDFSCSTFIESDKLTPLQTRALQFDVMRKGYAGGARTRAQKKSVEYSGLVFRKKCPKGSNWDKTSKVCVRKRKPITKHMVPVSRRRRSHWGDTSSSASIAKRSSSVKKRNPITKFIVPMARKTKRNSSKTSSW